MTNVKPATDEWISYISNQSETRGFATPIEVRSLISRIKQLKAEKESFRMQSEDYQIQYMKQHEEIAALKANRHIDATNCHATFVKKLAEITALKTALRVARDEVDVLLRKRDDVLSRLKAKISGLEAKDCDCYRTHDEYCELERKP